MANERILVVDDDLDSLKLIGLMLQRRGFSVSQASNGAMALSRARSDAPNLILLDVMMPDMDGYAVARQLRADPQTNHIPIIMFTAKTMVDDKVAGFDAGVDDYLTKPIHPDELVARIRSVLTRMAAMTVSPASSAGVFTEPAGAQQKGQVIAFVGAKGGSGTTTLAINTAVAIVGEDQDGQPLKVALAEVKPTPGSIGLLLNISSTEGLSRLVNKGPAGLNPRGIREEMVAHESGLRLLLAPLQSASDDRLTPEISEAIVRGLVTMADVVILDLGSGLDEFNRNLIRMADQVVITVEPLRISLMLGSQMIEELERQGIGQSKINAVLVNRMPTAQPISYQKTREQLGTDLLAVIAAAPELANEAAENATPMVTLQPASLPAEQIHTLARELLGHLGFGSTPTYDSW